MDKKALTEKAKLHLQVLCGEIGERRVGSEAKRTVRRNSCAAKQQLGEGADSDHRPYRHQDRYAGCDR